jgi:hypothetical protein
VASKNRPARGDVVTYRHPDPITGADLTGAGVVLSTTGEGAITIAPLAAQYLDVDPENVAAADLSTED